MFHLKNKIKLILSYENKQGAGCITERPEEVRVRYLDAILFIVINKMSLYYIAADLVFIDALVFN